MCCTSYTIDLSAVVPIDDCYYIDYSITPAPTPPLTLPYGIPVTSSVDFCAPGLVQYGATTYTTTVTAPLPLPPGTYNLSGSASLYSSNWYPYNTVPITFTPATLTCPTTPPVCSTGPEALAYNVSENSNNASEIVWFNSHFKLQGTVPTTGFTVNVTNQSITFGTSTLAVPDAAITFSSTASCASTSFNTTTNQWMTTIPLSYATQADEIFSAGLAYILPSSFPGNVNNVTWNATFTSTAGAPQFQFQYGAANYLSSANGNVFPLTGSGQPDYNAMMIDPAHNAPTCAGYKSGDHSGTPENAVVKSLVTGGGSGGGGSNWTGSWSSTPTYVCH